MRKILLMFLAICLLLATSCGAKDNTNLNNSSTGQNSNEQKISTDNINDYFSISFEGYGSEKDNNLTSGQGMPSYMVVEGFTKLTADGSIKGVSGYDYNNFELTIKFNFSYRGYGNRSHEWKDHEYSITDSIKVNKGGNNENAIITQPIHKDFSYAERIKLISYEIVDFKGTITKQ